MFCFVCFTYFPLGIQTRCYLYVCMYFSSKYSLFNQTIYPCIQPLNMRNRYRKYHKPCVYKVRGKRKFGLLVKRNHIVHVNFKTKLKRPNWHSFLLCNHHKWTLLKFLYLQRFATAVLKYWLHSASENETAVPLGFRFQLFRRYKRT